MGIMNDSFDVKPSMFNDDQVYKYITLHDKILLRIHYDKRIKAGMSKKDVMPIARQILSEIRPEGEATASKLQLPIVPNLTSDFLSGPKSKQLYENSDTNLFIK